MEFGIQFANVTLPGGPEAIGPVLSLDPPTHDLAGHQIEWPTPGDAMEGRAASDSLFSDVRDA